MSSRVTSHQVSDRSILVVGSWAKEQITVENLVRHGVKAHVYMDTANPGLVSTARSYRIGRLSDRQAIVDFAREVEADCVLVTTAGPLAAGAADALEEAGTRVFGPRRAAARLEWDKAFVRNLLDEARIDASPTFRVCNTIEEAESFAGDLDWDVAVKPIGLTDGLGVRVAGDHLLDDDDVRAAISEVLEAGRQGEDHQVLLERRLRGEEFTVQALAHGETLVAFPPVQDFKRLLPGDEGPNTGSMGSYACADGRLPFLSNDDLEVAADVMRATVAALLERRGATYTGFLYGQFMRTGAGIRLIEYNVRPGDPEWMNTVAVLEDNLIDLVDGVLGGDEVTPRLRPRATVCTYVTPPDYPARLDCVLEASADEHAIADSNAGLYHSCGVVDGELRVGSERGLAIVAEADSVPEARDQVLETIDRHVAGRFHHRRDIGARGLLEAKKARGEYLHGVPVRVRSMDPSDAVAVAHLLRISPPLEDYPLHLLLIAQRCFGRTCWVAEIGGEVVGWLMGLGRDHDPTCWFLWQVGVRPTSQRRGVARKLLAYGEAQLAEAGYERVEVTVDPRNEPSLSLFRALGFEDRDIREDRRLQVAGELVGANHYGPGRHFVLLEKRLVAPDRSRLDTTVSTVVRKPAEDVDFVISSG